MIAEEGTDEEDALREETHRRDGDDPLEAGGVVQRGDKRRECGEWEGGVVVDELEIVALFVVEDELRWGR